MGEARPDREPPAGRSISAKGLGAIVLWGASFVLTRVALGSFNPFGLVALRLVAGALLLLVMVRFQGRPVWPDRRDWPVGVFLGVVLALHLLMQAYGLQYTSAINTSWIIGFIPVTIALGSHLLGQQRIRAGGWLGVLVGTGGVLLVTMSSSPDFANARFGDLLQVLSCLTWTVYTLAGVAAMARSGALRMTTFVMLVAAGLVGATTIGTGLFRETVTAPAWLAVLVLGLFCGGLAYYFWFDAVTVHGPARTGSLLYLEPFVTLGLAAATLGEPVTIHVLFGGLCVLAGVWLVSRGTQAPIVAVSTEEIIETHHP